jgi:hypothetical protein
LSELYRNRLELIEANGKHVRILLQEAFFHPEIREALISTVFRDAKGLVQKLIEAKIGEGELRPLPSDDVCRMILSSMIGLALFKYVLEPEEFGKRDDEERIALTVDILLNGIAAQK